MTEYCRGSDMRFIGLKVMLLQANFNSSFIKHENNLLFSLPSYYNQTWKQFKEILFIKRPIRKWKTIIGLNFRALKNPKLYRIVPCSIMRSKNDIYCFSNIDYWIKACIKAQQQDASCSWGKKKLENYVELYWMF